MVQILDGKARLKVLDTPAFEWPESRKEPLIFRSAWRIEHTSFADGIQNCTYRVFDRTFRDLSFLKGQVLQEFSDDTDLRRHEDGTPFLFFFHDIPTFDEDDREWDGLDHMALYRDPDGVNLIHCRHGYSIPRISIYAGLTKSNAAVDQWLSLLVS